MLEYSGVHTVNFFAIRQGLGFVFCLRAWCVYSAKYGICKWVKREEGGVVMYLCCRVQNSKLDGTDVRLFPMPMVTHPFGITIHQGKDY